MTEEKPKPEKPERREFLGKTAVAAAAVGLSGVLSAQEAPASKVVLKKPIRAEILKEEESGGDTTNETKYIGADGAYYVTKVHGHVVKTDTGQEQTMVMHVEEFDSAGKLVRAYNFTTLATITYGPVEGGFRQDTVRTRTIDNDGVVHTRTVTGKVPLADPHAGMSTQQMVGSMLAKKGLN